MLTGDAYSSGHLVPSHLGLAYVLLVETNPFPELVFFPDYSLQTSVGTFSILPFIHNIVIHVIQHFRVTVAMLCCFCWIFCWYMSSDSVWSPSFSVYRNIYVFQNGLVSLSFFNHAIRYNDVIFWQTPTTDGINSNAPWWMILLWPWSWFDSINTLDFVAAWGI